jgi:hypothetical protein
MGNEYIGGIYIVAATKDRKTEYWAAAVPEGRAIEAVREQIAPGWSLSLTTKRLTPSTVTELKMRPNSVRQLKAVP